MLKHCVIAALLVLTGTARARAQDDGPTDTEADRDTIGWDQPGGGGVLTGELTVDGTATRGVTEVTRDDILERAPRTTPDLLDGSTGISVQHTHYAGGSPFVRGLTGQRLVYTLDGFRVGSFIMRWGPNQYLESIDPLVLEDIRVIRGGGSVYDGADAMGGVIRMATRDPRAPVAASGLYGRGATADHSGTGRAELDANFGPVQVLAGLGGATFGDLHAGAPLPNLGVPQYDGTREAFTGYDQVSGDAKVVAPLGPAGQITAAGLFHYDIDAPRTDQCSGPPIACLFYSEQFYDLAYARYDGNFEGVRNLRAGVAFSRTHERRTRQRASINRTEVGLDEVQGVQLVARADTPVWKPGGETTLQLSYGLDGTLDDLSSQAATGSMDGALVRLPRGRYVDGSRYMTLAGYVLGELNLGRRATVTAGARLTGVRADVGDDPDSGASSFDSSWLMPTATAGVRVRLVDWLSVVANLDQSFRAPDLDDLTARSQQAWGYQIGNPDLDTEASSSAELGVLATHRQLHAQLFAYGSYIQDYVGLTPIACPSSLSAQCGGLPNVIQLDNSDHATLVGALASVQYDLPFGPWLTTLFGNLTWTRGTRETLGNAEEPLTMIPPLSGRVGARARVDTVFAELSGRWASRQDRLSLADRRNPGVFPDGTPGYVTVDMRVGAMLGHSLRATLALENLTNENYRVHGSGLDGAGFGLVGSISGTLEAP